MSNKKKAKSKSKYQILNSKYEILIETDELCLALTNMNEDRKFFILDEYCSYTSVPFTFVQEIIKYNLIKK